MVGRLAEERKSRDKGSSQCVFLMGIYFTRACYVSGTLCRSELKFMMTLSSWGSQGSNTEVVCRSL